MTNIGDIKDSGEIRARQELRYEWVVLYSDGSELREYDEEKGLVNHFGCIDKDKADEFSLISKKDGTRVSVNLSTGLFYINGLLVKEGWDGKNKIPIGLFIADKKVVSPWGNKAKLIFWKNVRRDFNMGTGKTTTTIDFTIGWEADVDGEKEKRLIKILQDGSITIPQ